MNRKRWVGLGTLVVVVVVVGGIFADPTCTALGLLRREPFYRGRPTTYWARALHDPAGQAEAGRALKDGGAAAAPVLIDLLQGRGGWGSTEVRCLAAELLAEKGAEAPGALTALEVAVSDPDPHVRAIAITAVGKLAPKGEAAVPALVRALGGPDRLAAEKALSRFGPAARPAVPALIEVLKTDSDATVRWNAALTLGRIGPEARAAVPALIAALKDEEWRVREHAAESLGQIGPDAREAVVPLTEALADKEPRVRRDAVRSLGQLGPAAAVSRPAVAALLKDADPKVRQAAEKSLRQIAPKSPGE